MPKSRVLLTGASGFIGRHAARALVDAGYMVFAPTRDVTRQQESTPSIDWVKADLLDPSSTSSLTRAVRCDILLHLGWDVSPGYWTASSNLDWLAASLQLARQFQKSGGRRIVVAGTCAEYDWSTKSAETGNLSEESSLFRPATLYAQSKLALRNVLSKWSHTGDFSFAAGLLFFLYGSNEHPARLVPSVIHNLLAGNVVQTTEGRQVRDYLDARDAGSALAQLAASEVAGPVNIGSGTGKTIRSIVNTLRKQIEPEAEIAFGALPTRPDDPPRLVADITRLRNEVGYMPEFDLERGLSDCIEWWRSEHNLRY